MSQSASDLKQRSDLPILRRSTAFIVLLAVACLGCCPAWPPNAVGVQIASQEVLVYWDAANGIEHFVRRADFDADQLPDDFGFLVPTPSQPALSEAEDHLFTDLSHAIKPDVIYEKKYRLAPVPLLAIPFMIGGCSKDAADDAADAGVEVLETAFVGGFEAAVLRADDVQALIEWLEKNGYHARDELREWLTPYIEKRWIVTAFKFDCNPESRRSLRREAVRMSFATDKPFFPYRVPSDQLVAPENGSLLRMYYVGDQRPSAQFENSGESWSAATRFSAPIREANRLLAGLSGTDNETPVALPDTAWLTTFEDNTWPGGTEDLYFGKSGDQSEVHPPPVYRERHAYIWIPPDVLIGIAALIFFIRRRRRKDAAEVA